MVAGVEFQTKVLRRLTRPDEYRVYRAGLEWDLTDPIVIESADDFKSTPRWQDRLTPYHHQVTNLITFCRRLPVTLLADDVGLGKTISAGLVISELASRQRVSTAPSFLVLSGNRNSKRSSTSRPRSQSAMNCPSAVCDGPILERRACSIISADRKMINHDAPPTRSCAEGCGTWPMRAGASAIDVCSSCSGEGEPSGINRMKG
jgi:hypothetical protein